MTRTDSWLQRATWMRWLATLLRCLPTIRCCKPCAKPRAQKRNRSFALRRSSRSMKLYTANFWSAKSNILDGAEPRRCWLIRAIGSQIVVDAVHLTSTRDGKHDANNGSSAGAALHLYACRVAEKHIEPLANIGHADPGPVLWRVPFALIGARLNDPNAIVLDLYHQYAF